MRNFLVVVTILLQAVFATVSCAEKIATSEASLDVSSAATEMVTHGNLRVSEDSAVNTSVSTHSDDYWWQLIAYTALASSVLTCLVCNLFSRFVRWLIEYLREHRTSSYSNNPRPQHAYSPVTQDQRATADEDDDEDNLELSRRRRV